MQCHCFQILNYFNGWAISGLILCQQENYKKQLWGCKQNTRSCIISDHAARDLLAISDRAIVLANKKIAAIGKPSEILQNEDAKSAYFGDSFKIN